MVSEQAFPGIIGSPGHGNSTYFQGPNGENLAIEFESGMTLRDYFAAKAMAAIIETKARSNAGEIAGDAYHVADAMLAQRLKGGGV